MSPNYRNSGNKTERYAIPLPPKKYKAKKGQTNAAAIEPTDTYLVATTRIINIANSKRVPVSPKVETRHPTATAIPLPPLNFNQGLKIWPQIQPRKAILRHIWVVLKRTAVSSGLGPCNPCRNTKLSQRCQIWLRPDSQTRLQ